MEHTDAHRQQGEQRKASSAEREPPLRRTIDGSKVVLFAWLGMVVIGAVLAVVRATI
jgi:hypothetical protein